MFTKYLLLLGIQCVWMAASTDGRSAEEKLSTAKAGGSLLSSKELLDRGIDALGGKQSLAALKGVIFNNGLYRSQSLMQSFTPGFPDRSISTTGVQSISYNLSGSLGELTQRIDKTYRVDEYWIFLRPFLESYNASIVINSGANEYGCYVRGNENVAMLENDTWGYTDGAYTALLMREALRFSPKLLLIAEGDPGLIATTVTHNGYLYPSLKSPQLGLTIMLHPQDFLPYVVRAYEHHHIYGNSTSDLILYNYTAINGVNLPRRYKLAYNQNDALIDVLFDNITTNPNFSADFFDGITMDNIDQTISQLSPISSKSNSSEYGTAEVFEFSQNTLWSGGYSGKLSNITVTKPISSMPDLYHLVFNDAPNYASTIAVTEDAIMVTDAPPHQSLLVIKWIQDNFKRNPTHLLITHHHHDHNYGAADYAAVGAKFVVPEEFTWYWESVPGVQFHPVSRSQPFIHRSKSMQIRGVWPGSRNVHSLDFMYFTFSEACPEKNSLIALVEADVWNANFSGQLFDQRLATQFLSVMESHGMPREYLVLPIHGTPSKITELYELTGYDYPDLHLEDFKPGGSWC